MSKRILYAELKNHIYFDQSFCVMPNEILRNNCLDHHCKILFALLQDYKLEDGEGKIMVKNEKLANIMGVSVTIISNSLTTLEDNNYIFREGNRNQRVIKYCESIESVFESKDYSRIPLVILKHKDLTSKDKVLYTILLSMQYYKLINSGFNKDIPRTWFTQKVTRQRLAERLDCSIDSVSETLIKLHETKFNGKPLIYNSNGNFYSRKDVYSCNVMCPTTKEGYDMLDEDNEIEFINPYA